MRILVCVKQVPLTSDVAVDPATGVLRRDTGQTQMNPYDLHALEASFQLRQQTNGEVVALTMGPPQAESVLREALMMGCDHAVLLTDRAFAGSDVLATSRALAQAIKVSGPFDVVLCGKQTTDGDTAQVASEISELLQIPCIPHVRTLEMQLDGSLILDWDTGTEIETVKVTLPVVLSIDKDSNQPRLPSYRRMQQARKAEIPHLSASDVRVADGSMALFGLDGSPTHVVKIFAPDDSSSCELVSEGDLACHAFNWLKDRKYIGLEVLQWHA